MSGSPSPNLFRLPSFIMSNSGSSSTFGASPRPSLGVFGQELGTNVSHIAATLHGGRAAPAGQSSFQMTPSGHPSRPSSFKSCASPPPAAWLPSKPDAIHNFPHAAGSGPSSAAPSSLSQKVLIAGPSSCATSTSKNNGLIASSAAVSASTSRNSLAPALSSFPSRACMVLYRPFTTTDGILGGTGPPLPGLLGDKQRAGELIAYLYDPDEDDEDDGDEWLYDVHGDDEFIEYGFGPGRRPLVNGGSVASSSLNEKKPSLELTRKGSLESTAKVDGKSQPIPLPTSLSPPYLAPGLPPPAGHPSTMRIPTSGPQRSWHSSISLRGLCNVSGLVILILCLLGLFLVYPTAKALQQ